MRLRVVGENGADADDDRIDAASQTVDGGAGLRAGNRESGSERVAGELAVEGERGFMRHERKPGDPMLEIGRMCFSSALSLQQPDF